MTPPSPRALALVIAIGLAWATYTHASPAPITVAEAAALLSPGTPSTCPDVECLITRAFARDRAAQVLALALFRTTGGVAGVGPAETMDGGYRGTIQLVPQLPLGAYRQHLRWTLDALTAIDGFFTAHLAGAATDPPVRYRWRDLRLHFLRSVAKRTPSAYATGWTIAYNVRGSLLTTATGVRETLFHELFHLNDFEHGDWSATQLQADYGAIVARCGTRTRCLTPYAPNTTRVRATGTYYAFQPDNGNGVHEYAAELAVRYFKEHDELRRTGVLSRPAFKCGPAENARAWAAIVAEFFGGRDRIPPC